MHDFGPALERRDNEKRHHSLSNVVKVGIPFEPSSTSFLANPLGVKFVFILAAVEEHAHVGVHAIDCEHEPDDHNDKADIDD